MLKPQQTQRIYAMAARLGVLESGNKNDMLHTIVYRLTQKESIRSLDENEYKTVVSELAERLKLQNLTEPPKPYKKKKYEDSGRGKMTDGQRRKLKIDCTSKQPFRWLTYNQGVTLIEKLKKYIDSAQRRKAGENKS